jgi:hypothetical protein
MSVASADSIDPARSSFASFNTELVYGDRFSKHDWAPSSTKLCVIVLSICEQIQIRASDQPAIFAKIGAEPYVSSLPNLGKQKPIRPENKPSFAHL